jgi:hypothetical protein
MRVETSAMEEKHRAPTGGSPVEVVQAHPAQDHVLVARQDESGRFDTREAGRVA